jgi:cobalt-zinc-cadmium efflux system membrane fusion protein
MAVPENAITEFEDKTYLFIQKEKNTFEMIEVKTGAREFGLIEIMNSEALIDKSIVTAGAYSLLMSIKNIE